MSSFEYLKAVATVQLFWALAVTLVLYSLVGAPNVNLNLVTGYSNPPIDLNDFQDELNSGFNNQSGIAVVDIATLAFFSGNIIADLMLNFFTAVPQMFSLMLAGVFVFIPLDSQIQNGVKLFFGVIILALYIMALLQMLLVNRQVIV